MKLLKKSLSVFLAIAVLLSMLACFSSCFGTSGGLGGQKGEPGNGIVSIVKSATNGLVDTYTITYTDGTTTTFEVTNGEQGDVGNGITSINKTATNGLVDTYTITFTDGTTTTFEVTNGEKGDKGDHFTSIEKVEFDDQGRLVITLTDGTVLDPVEIPNKDGHTHTFGDWTPAGSTIGVTCDNRLYTHSCSTCNELEFRLGSAEDHSFKTEYIYNYNSHWYGCKNCDAVKDKEEHTYDETGYCPVCSGYLGSIQPLDWQGREFRVLATHNAYEPNFEIVGEVGGDRLSQAVYERNEAVKEFCNAEILDVALDEDAFNALEKDFEAGDGDYDLVFLIRDDMSSAIQRGYLKDLTNVAYINFENEWYNQSTIESMKISGRLYHMSSSFSLTDKARTATLFFNRDMADRLQLGVDVISEVKAGTWTIDKMYQMINTVATSGDTNGNGQVDKTDTFGIAGVGSESAVNLWSGMGNKLVNFNNGNNYGSEILTDRSFNGLETIKNMFSINEWKGFTGSEQKLWTKDYDAPLTAFVERRALFFSATMGSIEEIAEDADFAYTAITYPKYDTNQTRYYTTIDNTYSSTFGIPYLADDVSFSGYMIEVLSWKSHTTTYPEYYQVKCMVQKSYDPVCAEMLQLNYDSLVFDFGLMFSNTVRYKKALETYTTSKSNTQGMASLYESYSLSSNNSIEGIILTIEELPE